MQTDWSVGAVLKALDSHGLANNTLLIFTSDNGCAPYVGIDERIAQGKIKELERLGHYCSAQLLGYKSDIWDGGHRIPFLVRWPGKVKAGSISTQLVCLSDLMATCAELMECKLPQNAGEDSVNILPALLGTARAPMREAVVHHSGHGYFAIRQDRWKLVFGPGSGGWSKPAYKEAAEHGLPPVQLYDMAADIGEKNNLQAKHPEVVGRFTKLLQKYVADGRSTPGPPQHNDVSVDIWKRTP
jgi:arylsulfatase A-like enzyme